MVKKNHRPFNKRVTDLFLSFDQFGEDVGFNVGPHGRTYNSGCGSILSILLMALLIAYGVKNYSDLQSNINTTILQRTRLGEMNDRLRVSDLGIYFSLFTYSKQEGFRNVNKDHFTLKAA